MKKFFMVCIFAISLSNIVFATTVNVQLNGEEINFTDSNGQKVEAQIINDRTMVPLRKIFELLNADVEWDGMTNTVTATKEDIIVKLQIDNPIAEVTQNGAMRKITLDSKPVLVNSRTLVPLRFVSESLGKQVAWDNANQTAIIIDYDYFENRIANKSPLLYEFMKKDSNSMNINISREYVDLRESTNNNVSKVDTNLLKHSNSTYKFFAKLSGTSELFEEIKKEGWNSINIEVDYNEDGITWKTDSNILNKMITDKNISYKELGLVGKYNYSLSDMMKEFLSFDENKINIATFSNVKNEYEKFLNSFSFLTSQNSEKISLKDVEGIKAGQYIDATKFDNIIFNDDFVMTYNILNKLFFNYDVKNDELIFDYPNISVTIDVVKNENNYVLNMMVELKNNYEEKVVYNIKLEK